MKTLIYYYFYFQERQLFILANRPAFPFQTGKQGFVITVFSGGEELVRMKEDVFGRLNEYSADLPQSSRHALCGGKSE